MVHVESVNGLMRTDMQSHIFTKETGGVMNAFRINTVWWEEENDRPSYMMRSVGITIISDSTRYGWMEALTGVIGLHCETIRHFSNEIASGKVCFDMPNTLFKIKPTIRSVHVCVTDETTKEHIEWVYQQIEVNQIRLKKVSADSPTTVVNHYAVRHLDVSQPPVTEFELIAEGGMAEIIVLIDNCGTFDEVKYNKMFPLIKQCGIRGQVWILTACSSVGDCVYDALRHYWQKDSISSPCVSRIMN